MLESLKVTPFGALHTVIGVVSVVAGVIAFVRTYEISPRSRAGMVYLVGTILTCITALGIFHHGGFGAPHVLALLTLSVLGLAYAAGNGRLFGRWSNDVETAGYSLTFLFQMIPAVIETTTRLPIGAPLVDSPEAPVLQTINGLMFLVYLGGASLQVRRQHAKATNPGTQETVSPLELALADAPQE